MGSAPWMIGAAYWVLLCSGSRGSRWVPPLPPHRRRCRCAANFLQQHFFMPVLSLQPSTERHRDLVEAAFAGAQHHQFADAAPRVVEELLDRRAGA